MKQLLLATTLFCVCFTQLRAQTGDFNLPSAQRIYKTAVADSSLEGGPLKNLFIGKNYRKEWVQPVVAPVIKLESDFGGLKVEKEGGGKQTHSLQLKDQQDREWVLRSLKKYIESSVPKELKGTIGERLIAQGISGSYPYAALVTGALAKASNIAYLPNTLVYIPDDPALKEFREKYANTLSLLELRTLTENGKNIKPIETHKLLPELLESADKTVDQRKILRARLLDNFVFDFDRHEDQWVWIEKDSAGRTFYYPVPKDRDQAFFDLDGLLRPLAKIAGPVAGVFQGTRAKAKNIETFNFSARNFDRLYLTEPDAATWEQEIDRFLAAMTDEAIANAFNQLPQSIQPANAVEIQNILKEKRKYFREDMMKYYRFLAKEVAVHGSNEKELFNIIKNTDGSVSVSVQKLNDNGQPEFGFYNRRFDPAVTKEIQLYGLEADDRFVISGETTDIKIRIIGGPGNDAFINEAKGGEVQVYDVSFEKNTMVGDGMENNISDDPMNNEFRTRGFVYSAIMPGAMIQLSQDGGFLLGPALRIVNNGFRKFPFSSKHAFYAVRSMTKDYYRFNYSADFIGKKSDVLVRSDLQLPTIRTNFYGFGNNTIFNPAQPPSYYRVHYTMADVAVMVKRKITSAVHLLYGPVLQYYKLSDGANRGKFIKAWVNSVQDPAVLEGKWFGGAELRLEWNTKNDQLIPSRGVNVNIFNRGLFQFSGSGNHLNQTGARFSFYTDFLFRNHVILASSFGASHNQGFFEFPMAQYLGFKQDLRGHRFQRFAGRTKAFNNTDLRINVGTVNLYLVKGPAGLIGFHDVGRVWINNEKSGKWHTGYGGGVWLSPFNALVIVGALTFSKEEEMFPQVSFGFQF